MEEIKLKPCPFCGGNAVMMENRAEGVAPSYRVACSTVGCWCMGPMPHNRWGTEKAAARVWNRRAE